MQRVALLNAVGLSRRVINAETMPFLAGFCDRPAVIEPAFPAVTCTAQSNYLTGVLPEKHGVVANGWYDRGLNEVHFWKQSNRLVQAPKLWETLKTQNPGFTCANLFWWYNMATTADYSVTPRPIYRADGNKIFDITSAPLSIRDEIKADLGPFPFPQFWGPMAGAASSQWIARAARWTEERFKPTLNLVYLPHLDYNFQRLGPEAPGLRADLKVLDEILAGLVPELEKNGVQVFVLSEYSITKVSRPIDINRVLRRRGWITVKDEAGCEQLEFALSPAFAVADHQVAHVYVNKPELVPEVRSVLLDTEGVGEVLDAEAMKGRGIYHARSGELLAVAEPESWFTYYYWLNDNKAPDFARCVDIHRKPGYDPAELFLDPKLKHPKAKFASFLLRKKLGFRALMDVIPLDASLVKGSHGHKPVSELDWPVLLAREGALPETRRLSSADVFGIAREAVAH